jgi:histidinol-phosphate aminotransferase
MAGARLGFGVASASLIRDMNTVKYSTNPYNINRMTMAAGLGTLEDETTVRERCREIIETRDYTVRELTRLGFEMADSCTNFVFARHKSADGGMLYEKLKKNGILVRHFTSERIKEYNRITVGSRAQMETLIKKLEEILK